MDTVKTQYVAIVLPERFKFFKELDIIIPRDHSDKEARRHNERLRHELAEEAVKAASVQFADRYRMLALRGKQNVSVTIYMVYIKDGKTFRTGRTDHAVVLPKMVVTEADYNEELSQLMRDLPYEFRTYVTKAAAKRGNGDFGKMLVSAKLMLAELPQVIKDYTTRIYSEK